MGLDSTLTGPLAYASLRVLPVCNMVVWCQIDAFLFSLDYLDVCVKRSCDILQNILREP